MLSMIILNKLSYPTMLKKQSEHQRFTLPDPLVNWYNLLNFLRLAVDRDQTVSRRSKPSSRSILLDEQSNP
jgi:hypothetical protein